MEREDKLTLAERFSFGIGELPGAANAIIGAFLMMFYTDNIGMAAGAVGTMFLISRIFDGISDLIAGNIVDRTKTKWGKARPWLLWLGIPIGLSVALLTWVPENASSTTQMIYAFLTYNLFMSILYTMVNVAKSALMALMTQNPIERAKLAKYSVLFGLGGSMIGCSVAFPLINALGGDISAWRGAFAIFGTITSIGVLLSFALSYEHIKSVEETVGTGVREKISFWTGLKLFVQNKYFIFTLITNFLINLSNNLNSGSQTYFYKYAMNNEMLTTSLNLFNLVPMVFSVMFLGEPCIRKWGKKKSLYIGATGQILSYAVRGLAAITGNIPLLTFGTVLAGITLGPIAVSNNTLPADAVDYGEYLTNKRIEGMGSSVLTCANKLSTGLAGAMVGWVLSLTGFVANAVQSASTNNAIAFLFAWGPAILLVLEMILVKCVYRYDEERPVVMDELQKRKEKTAL